MRTFLKWLSYITIGVVGGIVCLILWATLVHSIINGEFLESIKGVFESESLRKLWQLELNVSAWLSDNIFVNN